MYKCAVLIWCSACSIHVRKWQNKLGICMHINRCSNNTFQPWAQCAHTKWMREHTSEGQKCMLITWKNFGMGLFLHHTWENVLNGSSVFKNLQHTAPLWCKMYCTKVTVHTFSSRYGCPLHKPSTLN